MWLKKWHCACVKGWHILVLASLGVAFLFFNAAGWLEYGRLVAELDVARVHHVMQHEMVRKGSIFDKDISGKPRGKPYTCLS